MVKKISIVFLVSIYFLLSSCGFKPIYKFNDGDLNFRNYTLTIVNPVSREIQEEVNKAVYSKENFSYEVLLNIQEDQTPLIINTNGTVAKYRIEISINFEIIKTSNGDLVSTGVSRGFAQYDVGESEFNNEDIKKRMAQNATKSALQIMASKVESSIAKSNDN